MSGEYTVWGLHLITIPELYLILLFPFFQNGIHGALEPTLSIVLYIVIRWICINDLANDQPTIFHSYLLLWIGRRCSLAWLHFKSMVSNNATVISMPIKWFQCSVTMRTSFTWETMEKWRNAEPWVTPNMTFVIAW